MACSRSGGGPHLKSHEPRDNLWLLHRLGHDPAYGSGPLATVVQDLLSVVIYMVIAGILVH